MNLLQKALGMEVEIKIEGEMKEEWENYIKVLESFVEKTPSPYLLTRIPEKTQAPYRVKVRKVPYLHYEVLLTNP